MHEPMYCLEEDNSITLKLDGISDELLEDYVSEFVGPTALFIFRYIKESTNIYSNTDSFIYKFNRRHFLSTTKFKTAKSFYDGLSDLLETKLVIKLGRNKYLLSDLFLKTNKIQISFTEKYVRANK